MKIMSRDFTLKEKILLGILTVILLGAVYYLAVDQPVRSALGEAASEQENLNTELLVLQQKAATLSRMKNELETIQGNATYGQMGSYSECEYDEEGSLLKTSIYRADGTLQDSWSPNRAD